MIVKATAPTANVGSGRAVRIAITVASIDLLSGYIHERSRYTRLLYRYLLGLTPHLPSSGLPQKLLYGPDPSIGIIINTCPGSPVPHARSRRPHFLLTWPLLRSYSGLLTLIAGDPVVQQKL